MPKETKLMVLFNPAVSLIKRLNFTKKAALIATVILITFSLLVTKLYQELDTQIKTAEQELIGLKSLPPLFKTIQFLQQHRGASAGILGGTEALSNQRLVLQESISTLLSLKTNATVIPSTEEAWKEVDSQWNKIIEQGMTWSIKQNFNRHVSLISTIHLLTQDIADYYQLTNHPRIDIYYLVNTALHQLSPAQEFLGQTRAFGTGILAEKESTQSQLIDIHTLATQSKNAIQSLNIDLRKMGQYNPEIKDDLNTASHEISENTKHIFQLVDTDIIDKGYKTSAEDYFNLMTQSIDGSYRILYEILFPTIELLIKQELEQAQKTLHITVTVTLLMFLFLLYLAIGIYLAIVNNINIISKSTLAFSKGDFSQRIQLDSESELKQVGTSFNAMADKLTTLMHDEKEDKARIKAIIESAQDALVQMNSEGNIVGWSHQAVRIFGWSHDDVIGKKLHSIIIPERYHAKHVQGLKQFIASGKGPILNRMTEVIALHQDGHEFPIELTIAPVEVDDGYEFNGFIRDITERKEAEENSQLASRVFNESHEGIIITDLHGIIIDVNPAFCRITGYSRNSVIGGNPSILSSGKQSSQFYAEMWLSLKDHGYWQGEVWNRNKSGALYAELLSISALTDDDGNVLHYVGMFSDITKSKMQQEELNQMAHYDVLTGLPNRALFSDRFHQALVHSDRNKMKLAVCFIDLDNFKPINDNFGHDVGDQLLIEVSDRIKGSLREEDTISRQGGDEFAILLGDIESYEQCQQTLDRIQYSLVQPYLINSVPHTISASIGVTLYPSDNSDIDTLMRHADQAMYQAKQAGRNRYHLFNTEHNQEELLKHHRLDEIERALVNNEFELYYQAKVNMRTGDAFGAEALIRWIHPEKGLIPPLDFLPMVEGTELEIRIGNWVIEQAIKQLEDWNQHEIQCEVSVNIASHHLLSDNFFKILDDILTKYPSVDSSCLQIEILESSALGDLNAISGIIKTCQEALGIKVALDDFGTGYSSLTHLRSLPANTIKIDQSFVRDMLDDPSDYAIIDGVIGLADAFSRDIIAEGVETTEHGLMLIIMGCYAAQGYGIAKPMPADAFLAWLNDYTPNQEWLDIANTNRTDKENRVKLFRLVTKHWENIFIANIQSDPETISSWPIMHEKQDHCAHWLKRARQEKLFTQSSITKLEEAHEEEHLIANIIFQKYQDGEIDEARSVLFDFQSACNQMSNVLGQCE